MGDERGRKSTNIDHQENVISKPKKPSGLGG